MNGPAPYADDRGRRDGTACMNCYYWQSTHSGHRDLPEHHASGEPGECRRYPPTKEGFPAVGGRKYCGEYEHKELRHHKLQMLLMEEDK